MKLTLVFALGMALTAAFVSAHAETYQWKDISGRSVISDTAPPRTGKAPRAIGAAQTAPEEANKTAESLAETPKTNAEKDLEFKKRQQDAKEKADKDAKEQAAMADKRENCERARRNLTALESSQPMATLNDKGERQLMDTSQRDQEMERARRFMAETCK